ncbi:flagellar protein MotY [Oceanobacter kriegii]|uniref:flagellar protein MotY n=1 Tax=Oceanobacter kriegii TaxID=64972 RepID=UPI00146E9F2D|nr:OmpA family protein [Oceanobacter kriegii]
MIRPTRHSSANGRTDASASRRASKTALKTRPAKRWLRLLCMAGLCGSAFWSSAGQTPRPLEYGLKIDNTSWMVYGSVFECKFEQPIPGYGAGIFVKKAGEDISFHLTSTKNIMDYSKAQVALLPPPWRPSERTENLGSADIRREGPLLALDSRRSNVFMHGLLEGKRPTISHHTYYDDNRYVRVYLSSVTFQDFYPIFMDCVAQLLPMNFDQVSRRKVFFKSGEDKIDAADVKVLDQIIYYVKHDPRVKAIYLDGHSDSVGRRYDNRQMSKRRVEDVQQYMLDEDVDPAMITTRFHGDRYPVASNGSANGRAQNRRVTIRLEMDEDMPIPDDLLFISTGPLR